MASHLLFVAVLLHGAFNMLPKMVACVEVGNCDEYMNCNNDINTIKTID